MAYYMDDIMTTDTDLCLLLLFYCYTYASGCGCCYGSCFCYGYFYGYCYGSGCIYASCMATVTTASTAALVYNSYGHDSGYDFICILYNIFHKRKYIIIYQYIYIISIPRRTYPNLCPVPTRITPQASLD